MLLQSLKEKVENIQRYENKGEFFWIKRKLRTQFIVEYKLMGKEIYYQSGGFSHKVVVPSEAREMGVFPIEEHIFAMLEGLDVECSCGSVEIDVIYGKIECSKCSYSMDY